MLTKKEIFFNLREIFLRIIKKYVLIKMGAIIKSIAKGADFGRY